MKTSVNEIFEMAAELSPQERATLAGLLVDTLETETAPEIERAWRVEIAKRVEEVRSGKVKLIPWETVQAELREIVGGA